MRRGRLQPSSASTCFTLMMECPWGTLTAPVLALASTQLRHAPDSQSCACGARGLQIDLLGLAASAWQVRPRCSFYGPLLASISRGRAERRKATAPNCGACVQLVAIGTLFGRGGDPFSRVWPRAALRVFPHGVSACIGHAHRVGFCRGERVYAHGQPVHHTL